MFEKLIEEGKYLLDQKSKHLAANLQLSKNTPTNDVNLGNLHREVTELKTSPLFEGPYPLKSGIRPAFAGVELIVSLINQVII